MFQKVPFLLKAEKIIMNNASSRSLGRVRALLEWASELLNKKWSGWTVTPETVMTTRQCGFVQLI